MSESLEDFLRRFEQQEQQPRAPEVDTPDATQDTTQDTTKPRRPPGGWARRLCLACGKQKRVDQFDTSRAHPGRPGERSSVCLRCKYGSAAPLVRQALRQRNRLGTGAAQPSTKTSQGVEGNQRVEREDEREDKELPF